MSKQVFQASGSHVFQQNANICDEGTLLDCILQGSNEGIVILNAEGTVLKHNVQFLKVLECSNNDLRGTPLSQVIPELGSFDLEFINYVAKRTAKKLSVRRQSYATDSEYYDILYISEVAPSDAILASQFEETRLYKEIYEKIMNSIDEGIHCIDRDGNIIIYNSAQEKIEGYRASEVIGKHVTEIYDLDEKTSLLLKVLEEGRPIYDYHQEYVTKGGRYIDVICSTVPLYSGNKIVGAAATLRDFSKFREMAEKILDLQEKLTLKSEKGTNQTHNKEERITFERLLGLNKQFLENIYWAKAAAKTDSPVLICGETGTGKELFAQSIHEESKRSRGPFLAINCAAIPENLLEGILFGTLKGAFTGAINRVGLLEQASGGSLFLDEINSMPLALQAKFLRVLEEKKIRRLGGNTEIFFDTRIISSCNVAPTTAIERGLIRPDLFYRLAVVYLFIPPLRDRLDDLDLLANYFIQTLNRSLEKNIIALHHEVISAFQSYNWPGNIRQLKHTIECAMNVISPEEKFILPAHIPQYLGIFDKDQENIEPEGDKEIVAKSPPELVIPRIKDQKKEMIISALTKSNGNMAKAAEDLNMSRQLLRYHLIRLGLK